MELSALDLSESSLFYFPSMFVRPEVRGSVTDRNVCEHALLGGMHGGIELEWEAHCYLIKTLLL